MNAIETLKAICEARAKATAGPWHASGNIWSNGGYVHSPDNRVLFTANERVARLDRSQREANATFLALAGSTDFPALLAEVKAMQIVWDAASDLDRSAAEAAAKEGK